MSGIGFLLASSFVLLLVSAANPRPGFSVGTSTKSEDIVKDGVVQPGWNSQFQPQVVPIGNFQLTWYTHMNRSDLGMAPPQQQYLVSWAISDTTIYSVAGVGINDTISTPGYPDRTDFSFTCNTFGNAWTAITISVPPYDDIVIYVQHLCQRATTFNTALVQFEVGSTNAILDGQPHNGFNYASGPNETFTQFYAWLTNDHDPAQQYAVTVTTKPVFAGVLTDVISSTGMIAYDQNDQTKPVSNFQIFYTCPQNQPTVTVTVHVFTGWHETMDFSYVKQCSAPNIQINHGFMVGFEKNGTEVVHGSVVSSQFSDVTPWTFLAGDITQTLWMWLDPTLSPAPTIDYLVQYSSTAGFVLGGTGFQGTLKTPTEGPEHDTTITFNLNCWTETVANFTVIISFLPEGSYSDVTLHFSKPCVDPQIDIGQYEVTPTGTILVPDLVHKNVVNPNMTVVEHDAQHSAFYIWIPKSYAAITPYQQFQVTSFNYRLDYMDATLKVQKGDKAHTSTSPAGTPFFLVTYRCVAPPVISESTLNLTVNYGWQKSVTFSWTKRCDSTPAPQPPSDDSSSAWSPFGIFAFTVFILILVWCLLGCAYNYIAKDQRGADAIPGINLYRSIYYKCFPSPKYTPQTDYNYSERETPDYGGTSYQSENL